jgi:hypothetical protein
MSVVNTKPLLTAKLNALELTFALNDASVTVNVVIIEFAVLKLLVLLENSIAVPSAIVTAVSTPIVTPSGLIEVILVSAGTPVPLTICPMLIKVDVAVITIVVALVNAPLTVVE